MPNISWAVRANETVDSARAYAALVEDGERSDTLLAIMIVGVAIAEAIMAVAEKIEESNNLKALR